jgi:isopentenyl-diphosphate delta-isomerase
LAIAAREFGLGMGLGSCRTLLENHHHLADFDIRSVLGDDQPLYANLGICQLEKLLESQQTHRIEELISTLQADGIIIHINPLQEAFQPEGDVLHHAPIDLIEAFLQVTKLRVIVKEVGQGMGPQSLARLLQLPLEAIEFGALGGTNFTQLELNRHLEKNTDNLQPFVNVGHTAPEMLSFINQYVTDNNQLKFPQLIISGGITSILDGYALVKSSKIPSVVGMGAALLKHAIESESSLLQFVAQLEKSWMLADAFLKIRAEKK